MMSELEFEIGRQMGATPFYLYQVLKKSPRKKAIELSIDSGLHLTTVRTALAKLESANIVNFELVTNRHANSYSRYSLNNEEVWKLY